MSSYPNFESHVELLLFFNYEDALGFFESNDVFMVFFNSYRITFYNLVETLKSKI